jgi:hypothetical protein
MGVCTLNAHVSCDLRLRPASGLFSLPETGSGQAETTILGREDLGWDKDSPEYVPL